MRHLAVFISSSMLMACSREWRTPISLGRPVVESPPFLALDPMLDPPDLVQTRCGTLLHRHTLFVIFRLAFHDV